MYISNVDEHNTDFRVKYLYRYYIHSSNNGSSIVIWMDSKDVAGKMSAGIELNFNRQKTYVHTYIYLSMYRHDVLLYYVSLIKLNE